MQTLQNIKGRFPFEGLNSIKNWYAEKNIM
jgi:hypothetical protein